MALDTPPIQEKTTEASTGRFPLVWLRWFQSVSDEINTISGGSP